MTTAEETAAAATTTESIFTFDKKAAETAAFVRVYEELRDEIVGELRPHFEMNDQALEWMREMIEFNVTGGKMNRGLTVVHSCQIMAGERELSAEETKKAAVLGWAIEWLQAFFLVADDVMDDSTTRRGQPCWFRRPSVRLIAINDAFLLESHVFRMLKTHFRSHPAYVDLLELFLEVTYQTELGQLLDLTSQPMDGPKDLSRFTMERYQLIVRYKTAFYSFYLPVACAMHLSGVTSPAAFATARDICVRMGEFFQIQDDYLDCYGEPAVIGKIGTDIQDNKCSWLVVQALNRVSESQRAVLAENYGKWDDASVAAVKALYAELNLAQVYADYEEESYAAITGLIGTLGVEVPPQVFNALLGKIYKRSK